MEDVLSQARAVLETTPRVWQELTLVMPAELLQRAPKQGEWSAMECLQHMIDTENVFMARLAAFRAGLDFPAFNPDAEGARPTQEITPRALADEFTRRRQESVQVFRAIQPGSLTRTAGHSELGQVTLGQMVHEWAVHDLNHTMQAQKALMQPFLQGVGPWRKYFEEHIIQAE